MKKGYFTFVTEKKNGGETVNIINKVCVLLVNIIIKK